MGVSDLLNSRIPVVAVVLVRGKCICSMKLKINLKSTSDVVECSKLDGARSKAAR